MSTDITWNIDDADHPTAYVRGWAAIIYAGGCTPDKDFARGYELKTYKFDTRGGADGWYQTLDEAKSAAEAFLAAAPAYKPAPRCHWCGCRLDRYGYCDECGEQF